MPPCVGPLLCLFLSLSEPVLTSSWASFSTFMESSADELAAERKWRNRERAEEMETKMWKNITEQHARDLYRKFHDAHEDGGVPHLHGDVWEWLVLPRMCPSEARGVWRVTVAGLSGGTAAEEVAHGQGYYRDTWIASSSAPSLSRWYVPRTRVSLFVNFAAWFSALVCYSRACFLRILYARRRKCKCKVIDERNARITCWQWWHKPYPSSLTLLSPLNGRKIVDMTDIQVLQLSTVHEGIYISVQSPDPITPPSHFPMPFPTIDWRDTATGFCRVLLSFTLHNSGVGSHTLLLYYFSSINHQRGGMENYLDDERSARVAQPSPVSRLLLMHGNLDRVHLFLFFVFYTCMFDICVT